MDLRVEIQGAFQEIVLPLIQKDLSSLKEQEVVLPLIQKDLSSLKEDVQDMRRDLQLLSSGNSRRPSADIRGSFWSTANLMPGRDTVLGRNDSTDADAGRLSSRSGESWATRALRKKSSKGVIGEQILALPNFIPESQNEDESPTSERAEDQKEKKEDAEAVPNGFRVIVPEPPPQERLKALPPSNGEDEQTRMSRASNTSLAYPESTTSSNPRRPKLARTMTRQSMAAGKVSLAIARHSEMARTSAPLTEWMWSLTRSNTYRSLTASGMLQSSRFDNIISILILGNALTIGLEADYAARNVTETIPWPYRFFEIFFCVVFTSELILRVWVHQASFFWKRDRGVLWNYFDLLVVGAQLVQESIELMKSSTSANNDAGNLRILRILRVLRIVRIFRLVRVLHLISELRTIVSSIMGSFKSLFWTVVLLLLMMYIVGVWFLQSVTDHLIERSDEYSDGKDIILSVGDARLRKHFDSLGQTILSLWQSLSGGLDWSEVADPLMSEVGVLLALGFAAFIAFSLLALMNVVTGVFVQTALHSAEQEEENFLTSQIIQLFQKCKDSKGRTRPRGPSATSADIWGVITEKDLEERLEDPALAKEWSNISVSADEAQYVFALLDVEEKGEVQFEEFLSACLRLKGNAKSLDMLIQLQESRHNAKVIEEMLHEMLTRADDIASMLPQYLQDKMGQESPKSQDGKDGQKAFPKSPRHSGSETVSARNSVGNTFLIPGNVSPRHSDSQL